MKRRCRVCGKEYEYCYSCEKIHSWRSIADTIEHYYILCVLMDYQVNHDAVSAFKALEKRGVDFHEIEDFLSGIQKLLKEVDLAHENNRVQEYVCSDEVETEIEK